MNELVVRTIGGPKTKELARNIRRRVPDLVCRVCGRRDFALIEDVDGNSRTTLERKPIGGGLASQFALQPLVTLACTTCGHVEQFLQAVLDGSRPDEYGQEAEIENE